MSATVSPEAMSSWGAAPAEGRWFLDTWMRVLADSESTAGAMSVIEWRGGAGFSPPRHVHHDEDTAMIVLAGRLTVQIGDDILTCGPGELAWLPREIPHSFRVDSETADYLELVTPAGFENFHLEGSRTVTSGSYLPVPHPVDGPTLAAHAARYRCDIIGPPME